MANRKATGTDSEFDDEFEVAEDGAEGSAESEGAENDVDDSSLDEEEDLSAVKMPEPLPRGWYTLTIVSAVPGMSQGNPAKNLPPSKKIDVRAKVEGGDHDGRNVFDILSFSPGAIPFTKQTLVALGISANDKSSVREKAERLLHVTAQALIDIQKGTEEYPGDRNRIRRWRALPGE